MTTGGADSFYLHYERETYGEAFQPTLREEIRWNPMPLPHAQTITAIGCVVFLDGNSQLTPQSATSQPILFQGSTFTSPCCTLRYKATPYKEWPCTLQPNGHHWPPVKPNPTLLLGSGASESLLAGRTFFWVQALACAGLMWRAR
jgi:hypothetical protein